MTVVTAVLPAAGSSRRMGRPKLLLPFRRDCVLGATEAALGRGGAERRILVIAPGDERLRGWALERGLEVAVNPDPDRGMLSSIQIGLLAAGDPKVLLVCPADLPLLQPETVRTLLKARAVLSAPLAVPTLGGKRGHPLLIARARIPEINDLDPAVGLRQLLLRHPDEVLEIPVDDPGILRDVDTPDDYREISAGVPSPPGRGLG